MTPAQYLPRFRRASRMLPQLEARESWSRSDIESLQLERLNELWAQAIRHVPYYRELQDSNHTPQQFASLSEFTETVPRLGKERVRGAVHDFLSDCHDPGSWHRTGGSTGKPMPVFWSKSAHSENLLTKYRHDQMYGLEMFDPKTFVWGHAHSFAPGIKGLLDRMRRPLEDHFRNRLRLSAYQMSDAVHSQYLNRIRQHGSRSIYGYSTAVYLLANCATQIAAQLPKVKLVTLTAEPLHNYMVTKIESAFGVPAVAEYGAVECGVIATEFPDRTLRIREDMCFVETVPAIQNESTCDKYEIIVTVLTNPSFPLIRYSIGDVTNAPISRPDVGFSILGHVDGRSNDMLMARNGEIIHPNAIKNVVEFVDAIRFQGIQAANGDFVLKLERPTDLRPAERHRLTQHISNMLAGHAVEIIVTSQLETSAAGKHRWLVSEMTSEGTA